MAPMPTGNMLTMAAMPWIYLILGLLASFFGFNLFFFLGMFVALTQSMAH